MVASPCLFYNSPEEDDALVSMASRLRRRYQFVLVLLALGGTSSPRNVTIDDADDSIQYSGNWETACPLPSQNECPDLNKTHDNTLHWAWPSASVGSRDNITIQFAGTAVYVYNVLANVPPNPILPKGVTSNIAFTLDGSPVRPYNQSEDLGNEGHPYSYSYRRLVYANAGLSNGEHELVIIADQSLVMFDYITYTSNDRPPPAVAPPPPPTASSAPPISLELSTTFTTSVPHTVTTMISSLEIQTSMTTTTATPVLTAPASVKGPNRSTGAIVGGVVGGVLALLLLAAIALFVRGQLLSRRDGKRMRPLLDEGPPPHTNALDQSTSNRSHFLRPAFPALRPSPDVPRSPGLTMSSMPTSPTSYGGEPPSRTYMHDGTVARIVEKADRARMEWPPSTVNRSTPIESGFQ